MDAYLRKTYSDPENPGALGGVKRLYEQSKRDGKKYSFKMIKDWLAEFDAYTQHAPARRKYPRRRTLAFSIDQYWQCDLVDMSKYAKYNNNYTFILTIIDVFSKFAFVRKLKRKSAKLVTAAFKSVFSLGRKSRNISSDSGLEFRNNQLQKLLKKLGVTFFITDSEQKAAVVERFNRTFKQRLHTYMTIHNTNKYIDKIQDIVDGYNGSKHRSIGISPKLVNKQNEDIVRERLFGVDTIRPTNSPKFSLNETVRISIHKRPVFDKSFTPNYVYEHFTIAEILPGNPNMYRLKEDDGTLLGGRYYGKELIRVIKPKDAFFKIEKILKTRKVKVGKRYIKEYLVKFVGFADKYNSWTRDLKSL